MGEPACGGTRIKKILRSRLPERFAGKLPPFLVEVAVGVGLPLLIVGLRLLFFQSWGEMAPLAPVFVAIVAAAVLAGWRAGLMTLVIGQSLIWILIMAPRGSLGPKEAVSAGVLMLATICELAVLLIIALYQREVAIAWSRRESQMGLLQKALKEIDHRTSNNYQTVMALVIAQSKRARDPAVKEALQQVTDRIRAISAASTRLAVASESLQKIRIGEHLADLCKELEHGLSRDGVRVECEFDDMVLGADETVSISILVNELVTNALKHAFPDDHAGQIRISLKRVRRSAELIVADNGVGTGKSAKTKGTGLGKGLVETFVKQLDARHEVETDDRGTRHRILFSA